MPYIHAEVERCRRIVSPIGEVRAAVPSRFVADPERDQATGPVRLGAVALLGLGRVPETSARDPT